jgi:hypothetical protein
MDDGLMLMDDGSIHSIQLCVCVRLCVAVVKMPHGWTGCQMHAKSTTTYNIMCNVASLVLFVFRCFVAVENLGGIQLGDIIGATSVCPFLVWSH